jgi:hypothetical protein
MAIGQVESISEELNSLNQTEGVEEPNQRRTVKERNRTQEKGKDSQMREF